MMRREQIKADSNAANMSAVWMYLKLSEKDAKIITSTGSKRLFSTALRLHYCMMIEITEWPQTISK